MHAIWVIHPSVVIIFIVHTVPLFLWPYCCVRSPDPRDPPSVTAARQLETYIIKQWISNWVVKLIQSCPTVCNNYVLTHDLNTWSVVMCGLDDKQGGGNNELGSFQHDVILLQCMVHSLFEFSGHLTKFAVIEKLTESLPCGRIVTRRWSSQWERTASQHSLSSFLLAHTSSCCHGTIKSPMSLHL